ncbi:hypothetical protein Adu01nite_36050 [Paractinoplanes durhamensis]|uniref:Uncharacterized protein n=2 Tax=Paractinoplanes durhamensis TaxID=113563 RepID=A0ABQ3YXF6_9ACTN|nr:hypothetical protein Adu01nite_36050 [Actinoplanes durhamensis]
MTYDAGWVVDGRNSVPHLDPDLTRRELTIIRDDLHCTAVQIVGGDPERLEAVARIATGLGLEVWFTPYPLDLSLPEIHELLVECARRAATIPGEVVFVAGAELTIMNRGFIDGDRLPQRLAHLFGDPATRPQRIAEVQDRLGRFFRATVPAIREVFTGRVTYAAIQYEGVDWTQFDIITFELIRSAGVAGMFREAVRTLVTTAAPKPLAITGFGTATWRGAGDVAPQSMDIIEYDEESGLPLRLNGVYERDEEGQARYLDEVLQVFDSEGVDSTFIHLFALHNLPHRPDGDPPDDLDLASGGIVKVYENRTGTTYPDMPWEPKAAFTTVATRYA